VARQFTEAELEAFLEESLAPEDMAVIEAATRNQPRLTKQLAAIIARRDAGVHSLGGIWRRHRVSCPTREQLGSCLLGALDEQTAAYIQFHIEVVGCRVCRANYEDLRRRQEEAAETTATRRRRYFQSSAGYLRGDET
jgi:hypothetical protein